MIFVVPDNDLEAKRIIEILKDQEGFTEGKDLFITKQGWGASWDGLEPEIKEALKKNSGQTIYGVELQGKSPYINIDHHAYEGDDRSNSLSSIEQVANIFGRPLSMEDMFIARNDAGHIDAMRSFGEALGLSEEAIEDNIRKVRLMDRQAQGITKEQEEAAEQAVSERRDYKGQKGDLTVVTLPHSKCATVTDRLYGSYENLLIFDSTSSEVNFYGKQSVIGPLFETLGGWKGGGPVNGFWGKDDAKDADVFNIIGEELGISFVKEAIRETLATMPDYFDSCLRTRTVRPNGSYFAGTTKEQLKDMLLSAKWREYKETGASIPGCRYFVTEDIPGGIRGIVNIDSLPDNVVLKAEDPKGVGRVSMVVDSADIDMEQQRVPHTCLITGMEEIDGKKHEIVFTFHPDWPISPSIISTDTIKPGTEFTKEEAKALGYNYVRIEITQPVLAVTKAQDKVLGTSHAAKNTPAGRTAGRQPVDGTNRIDTASRASKDAAPAKKAASPERGTGR